MLSGIMMEAGQGSGMTLNFDTVNEDAAKILTEAATVAEQKIKDKFPDLPPGMPSAPASQAEKSTESLKIGGNTHVLIQSFSLYW